MIIGMRIIAFCLVEIKGHIFDSMAVTTAVFRLLPLSLLYLLFFTFFIHYLPQL